MYVNIFNKLGAVYLFIHSFDLILMPHDVDLSVSPACVKRNLNEECFFSSQEKREGRLIATSIESDEISQFFFFAKSSDTSKSHGFTTCSTCSMSLPS